MFLNYYTLGLTLLNPHCKPHVYKIYTGQNSQKLVHFFSIIGL